MSTEDPRSSRRPARTVRDRARRRDDGPGAATTLVVLGVLSIVALVAVIVAGIDRDQPARGTAGSGLWLPGQASLPPQPLPVPIGSVSPTPSPSPSRPGSATTSPPRRPRTSPPATRTSPPDPPPAGPLRAGAAISLAPAGAGNGLRLRHRDFRARVDPIGPHSPAGDRADATFTVRTGLGDPGCFSFEASNYPGRFLRHQNFVLRLHRDDGTELFDADATFCPREGDRSGEVLLRAVNYPRYLRVRDSRVMLGERATPFTVEPPL